jgi:hypothetical protein
MIRPFSIAALAVLACSGSPALAQEPRPLPPVVQIVPPQPVASSGISALKVDVTIARDLNGKTLSSTPYSVSIVPGTKSQLRMGGDVPVPSTTFTPAQKEGEKPAPLVSFSYRTVGTLIDAGAEAVAGGQWRITLNVEDSSIYPADLAPASAKVTGAPAFRSFRSNNALTLRDGQSMEYTMATDRVTGEVYRVSLKLTVVK